MKERAIIIGASTVGKTTLINHFRNNSTLPVAESDEKLKDMNGGTWPWDDNLKMNVLAPRMVNAVLNSDAIIFFSNTHYFKIEDLQKAKDLGFSILQLTLDRKEMTVRSNYRHKHEGYEDHTKYFDDMVAYQEELSKSGLIDAIVDTDKPVKEVAKEITDILEASK